MGKPVVSDNPVVSDKSTVGKDRSVVGDSVDNGTMGNCVHNGVGNSVGLRVGSNARVLNGGNVAGQVVGVVGDGLDPAVGEVDGVRSGHGTGAIVGFTLAESCAGVVVSDGVLIGVGGGLSEVGGSIAGNGVDDRGRVVLGSGGGNGHKGKGGEGLKVSKNIVFDWCWQVFYLPA